MKTTLTTTGVTESVLYVDDLDRARDFYIELLGAPIVRQHERFAALKMNENQVLLLFVRGASTSPTVLEGGTIPPHDGSGPHHICFGMAAHEVSLWEEKLDQLNLAIEGRVQWPSGAVSLYFRDPDGHNVELATPGIWE
ncbi:MAG TPA: VOC family protein [Chthoniobacteraceae bacterium]|jgi:catechol 2,3-dioxygenase-like lactoylglutathione lyase family enzyme|nr:VOC family protein [Chthoniobacteraceae bacterium]